MGPKKQKYGATLKSFISLTYKHTHAMVKEGTFGEYGKFGEEKQAEEKPHHLFTDKAAY